MPKGKPSIDSERCKGCSLCIVTCPQKILQLSEDTNSQGINYTTCINEDKCTACTMCARMCPECAIEIYRFTGDK